MPMTRAEHLQRAKYRALAYLRLLAGAALLPVVLLVDCFFLLIGKEPDRV
jgi:hypothetical protein